MLHSAFLENQERKKKILVHFQMEPAEHTDGGHGRLTLPFHADGWRQRLLATSLFCLNASGSVQQLADNKAFQKGEPEASRSFSQLRSAPRCELFSTSSEGDAKEEL